MELKDELARITFSFSVMLRRYKDTILGDDFQKLTINQYFYLRVIENLGSPTFGELAAALKVSRPTVTIAVAKLVKLGFVVKETSRRDARFSRIVLTELGRRIARADYAAYDAFLEKLETKLTPEEQAALGPLLGKVVDAALECAGVEDRDVDKLWVQYVNSQS